VGAFFGPTLHKFYPPLKNSANRFSEDSLYN